MVEIEEHRATPNHLITLLHRTRAGDRLFFSSRSRHTRCSRDWSSDVCSSDLVKISDPKIPSDEIPLFNQPTLVSEFGVTWVRDSRNNPADASKGSFNSADFGVSGT